MGLDLAHRQATGIKADDLAVEALQPGYTLGHQLWFERPGPIARNRKFELTIVGQNCFAAATIAAVAPGTPGGSGAFLIAKMVRQFRAQHAFHQRLLQLAVHPAVAQKVIGAGHPSQQFVQKLGFDRRHRGSLSTSEWNPTNRLHKEPDTLPRGRTRQRATSRGAALALYVFRIPAGELHRSNKSQNNRDDAN